MTKILAHCFGVAAIICTSLLGLTGSAHAQSVNFVIYVDTVSGPARQMVGPQVIHVRNDGSEATGVTVTFAAPKGAKVDTTCQEDHLPGGVRSYTCALGTLVSGQIADIAFSISMNKSGTAEVGVEATCDQGNTSGALLSITIS